MFLAFVPNSNIVSGSRDKAIKIWQSESPYQCIATLSGHIDYILALGIFPNLNIASGSDQYDRTFRIWQIEKKHPNENNTLNSFRSIFTSANQISEITALAFFNYNYLFVGFADSLIKYWNIVTFSQSLGFISEHNQAISCLFNLNDQYLLSGSLDRKIVIYDLNLNKYDELTVHKGRINSIVYLTNQSYLVSSSYDTSIIYWKTVSNLTQINQLDGHSRQINDVIQLTNNYLVSVSDDFTLKVWSQYSNIFTLQGHSNDIYSLVELASLERMASCSKDKSIIIWDTINFQPIKYLLGHLGPVICLAI